MKKHKDKKNKFIELVSDHVFLQLTLGIVGTVVIGFFILTVSLSGVGQRKSESSERVPDQFVVSSDPACSSYACPDEGNCLACNNQCTDLNSDRLNCGSCGLACDDDQSCVSGLCKPECGDSICDAALENDYRISTYCPLDCSSSSNAHVELSIRESSIIEGSPVTLIVEIDTQNQAIDNVDIALTLDQSEVDIADIVYGTMFDNYKTGGDFYNGIFTISGWFDDVTNTFSGKDVLARLTLVPKDTDNINVQVSCQNGSTSETNLSYQGSDLVDCSRNVSYLIQNIQTIAVSSCTDVAPAVPVNVVANSGPGDGQIALSWDKVSGATHYSITFGEEWLNFEYGASNVGDTSEYVVNFLDEKVPYYFVVTAVNGCASSGYSQGVAAYAGTPDDDLAVIDPLTLIDPSPSPDASTPTPDTVAPSVGLANEEIGFLTKKPPRPSASPVMVKETQKERGVFDVIFERLPWVGLIFLLGISLALGWYIQRKKSEFHYYDEVSSSFLKKQETKEKVKKKQS